LSRKSNTPALVLFAEAYFNGWRNYTAIRFLRTAEAATSFFRLLSKKPGEAGFFDSLYRTPQQRSPVFFMPRYYLNNSIVQF
jgi:hypothetical protein